MSAKILNIPVLDSKWIYDSFELRKMIEFDSNSSIIFKINQFI
jgi:hypothetical protein